MSTEKLPEYVLPLGSDFLHNDTLTWLLCHPSTNEVFLTTPQEGASAFISQERQNTGTLSKTVIFFF